MDQVEEAVSIADLDSDDLDFDAEPAPGHPLSPPPAPRLRGRAPGSGEDLPFDPYDARLFDAEPGFDEDGALAPRFSDDELAEAEVEVDPAREAAAPDSYGIGLDTGDFTSDGAPIQAGAEPTYRTELDGTGRTPENELESETREMGEDALSDPGDDPSPSGTTLEDDLDEADFFVSQGLWEEARDILRSLLHRHAHHPLVHAKLRDVEAMAAAGVETAEEPPPRFSPAVERPLRDQSEVSARHGGNQSSAALRPGRPVVLLENPIEDSDADTHFDLGLAYKEMGLLDEAIKAFHKVLSASRREVQSHMMIGLCHREQGNLSEAINQFKAGLYVDKITSAEKFGLYYEIGSCYEDLQDPQEALYYYEMVLKKEHGYRDVTDRVVSIRASLGGAAGASSGQGGKRQSTLDAETDAALDHLKR
jgi:hypothetical protein